MKAIIEIQYQGNCVTTDDLEKAVKSDIKAKGYKMVSIDTLNIYYKPEETKIYYVAILKESKDIVEGSLYIEK